ncbi:hypothetical protein I3842_01G172900 [Carya illinoinensis]|uniref:Uncharacterized protein n=1 Tax=Carya illinoinensis TaxID=32201 RepID=A0A922G501_CARIL|nr:hypothetical protein I3842_01G172900 [Carya illinoinensis]
MHSIGTTSSSRMDSSSHKISDTTCSQQLTCNPLTPCSKHSVSSSTCTTETSFGQNLQQGKLTCSNMDSFISDITFGHTSRNACADSQQQAHIQQDKAAAHGQNLQLDNAHATCSNHHSCSSQASDSTAHGQLHFGSFHQTAVHMQQSSPFGLQQHSATPATHSTAAHDSSTCTQDTRTHAGIKHHAEHHMQHMPKHHSRHTDSLHMQNLQHSHDNKQPITAIKGRGSSEVREPSSRVESLALSFFSFFQFVE